MLVAIESEADEHEVLRDHLAARPGEVERKRRHMAAEIIDVEHEVPWQCLFVPPDDPSDARIHESILVARGVDRLHPVDAEVPLEVRLEERSDESARGAVDMDRDVDALVALEPIERGGDLPDRLVAAIERRAEDPHDADRVLVALGDRLLAPRDGIDRPPSGRGAARPPSSGRTSPSTPGHWPPSRGSACRSACRRRAFVLASATSAPSRPASPPRWTRWSSSPSPPHGRASSRARRASAHTAPRSPRSSDTRPYRSCSSPPSRP